VRAEEVLPEARKHASVIVSAGTVLASDRDLTPGHVSIDGARIARVAAGPPPAGVQEEVLAFPDGTLTPGFIDLQVNGGAGVDCLRCPPAAYATLGRYLAATGVTAYLPTITSAPLEEMRRAVDVAAAAAAHRTAGPWILGVHLEGPYLNPLRRGAHRAADLRHPSLDEMAETHRRAKGMLKIVTLAPELEGAEAVVRWLAAKRVIVSVGHTDAGYDEVMDAARWGARMATHVFNAMRGFHHREPGAAGAALLASGLTLGVIADLVHLHPAVLQVIARVAGLSRIALVTDAIAAAGMGRGRFPFGEQTVTVQDGVPRLGDGTIAGSVLAMVRAVHNFASAAPVSLRDAVQAASLVPARLLGLSRKGRISAGADADLAVLGRDGEVVLTLVGGAVAFRRGAAA
jgi:N-acetylglucosamine-6-phosphate deacetylase